MKGKQNAYSLQQNKKFVLDKGYSLVSDTDYCHERIKSKRTRLAESPVRSDGKTADA